MQLSETDAYAILQAHCSALYGRLVFLERECHDTLSVRKRIAIECLQLTDEQVNSGLGVQLRMALDIVNAMSCCEGLEPHKNLRFWRHAVCSLWVKYPAEPVVEVELLTGREVFTPEPSEFLPFDAAAFSQFLICVLNSDERGLTARVCLLWRQLAGVSLDVEPFDSSRAALALARVRSFVPNQCMRPLTVTLQLPHTSTQWSPVSNLSVKSKDVAIYASTLKAIGAHVSCRGNTQSHVDWSLQLDNLTGSSRHLSWLRRLAFAHPKVPATHVTLFWEPIADPRSKRAVIQARCDLLHSLVLKGGSLLSLTVIWERDARATGEVFSLIPLAAAAGLATLTLTVSSPRPADTAFWNWLAFALLHPEMERQASAPLRLAIATEPHSSADIISGILTTKQPLRPIAESLLRGALSSLHHVHWFFPGAATARVVVSNTVAYSGPECDATLVRTRLHCPDKLDAVVVVASHAIVGVVVPAYGLCWVMAHTVEIEETGRWLSQQDGARGLQILHELTGVLAGLPPAQWFRAELSQLTTMAITISDAGPITAAMLRSLLRSCRNLRRFELFHCVVDSLEPLVSAYSDRRQPCRISSLELSIRGRREGAPLDLVPLMEMLADPTHPSARVLTQFSLAKCSWSMLEDFAQVLRGNRSLTQICLGFDGRYPEPRAPKADQKAAMARLFDPFAGEVLVDGRGPRLGLLSVIRSQHVDSGSSQLPCVLSRMDSAVLRMIFEFVGPTVVRHVRWWHRLPINGTVYD